MVIKKKILCIKLKDQVVMCGGGHLDLYPLLFILARGRESRHLNRMLLGIPV